MQGGGQALAPAAVGQPGKKGKLFSFFSSFLSLFAYLTNYST
jgi:hypothetical protein